MPTSVLKNAIIIFSIRNFPFKNLKNDNYVLFMPVVLCKIGQIFWVTSVHLDLHLVRKRLHFSHRFTRYQDVLYKNFLMTNG